MILELKDISGKVLHEMDSCDIRLIEYAGNRSIEVTDTNYNNYICDLVIPKGTEALEL